MRQGQLDLWCFPWTKWYQASLLFSFMILLIFFLAVLFRHAFGEFVIMLAEVIFYKAVISVKYKVRGLCKQKAY